jgi:Cu+-exporting ATPase
MAEDLQVSIPITGMTCANCVATVERNIKKLDGVSQAVVNLSSERATVNLNPGVATIDDVIERVQRAGYGVASGQADLVVQRMSDDNDARRLEKILSQMDGVISAQVNFASEKAQVEYIPTIVSQVDLRKAITEAGFLAIETGGDAEDAERKARLAEINKQRRLLIVGLIFPCRGTSDCCRRSWPARPGWIGCCWLWQHPSSSTSVGIIMLALTNPCAMAQQIWTY